MKAETILEVIRASEAFQGASIALKMLKPEYIDFIEKLTQEELAKEVSEIDASNLRFGLECLSIMRRTANELSDAAQRYKVIDAEIMARETAMKAGGAFVKDVPAEAPATPAAEVPVKAAEFVMPEGSHKVEGDGRDVAAGG